jgi:hypothetical protein
MTTQLAPEGTAARTTQPAVPARPGWLRRAWHQIRAAAAEMNYASRRVVELQAPWAIDDKWHTR